MKNITLTRKQYDQMIESAQFNKDNYLACARKWSLEGVTITANEFRISELIRLLEVTK